MPKCKLWSSIHQRRLAIRQRRFPARVDDDGKTLNLWGFWFDPSRQGSLLGGACDGVPRPGLFSNIAARDGDLAVWLMNWFGGGAEHLREPMEKSRTAPVNNTARGGRKSLMVCLFWCES